MEYKTTYADMHICVVLCLHERLRARVNMRPCMLCSLVRVCALYRCVFPNVTVQVCVFVEHCEALQPPLY